MKKNRRINLYIAAGLIAAILTSLCMHGYSHKEYLRELDLPPVRQLAIADSLAEIGKTDEALARYHMISEHAKDINIKDTLNGRAALTASLVEAQIQFNHYNDYARELTALKRGMKIAKRHGLSTSEIDFLLASLYCTIADQNNADEYFDKSAEIFSKILTESPAAYSHIHHFSASNIIIYSDKAHIREKAKESLHNYFTAAIRPDQEHYRTFNRRLMQMLSDVKAQRHADAMLIADTLRSDHELPSERVLPAMYFISGQIASEADDRDIALKYFNLAESMIDPENGADMLLEVYEALADEFEKKGDSRNMGLYAMKAGTLRRNLTSFSQISSLKNVEIEDEFNEIRDNLTAEKNRSAMFRTWTFSILGAFIVAATFIGLLVYFLRKLRQSNRLLYSKHVDLLRLYEQNLKNAETKPLAPEPNADAPALIEETSADHPNNVSEEDIKKIEDILNDRRHISSPDFSIASLSVLSGIKQRALSAIISEHYGTSFRNLVNTRRIRLVCLGLETSRQYDNLTVDAIAESVGIKSRTTFTAAFKNETGMTPAQYIRFANERKPDRKTT